MLTALTRNLGHRRAAMEWLAQSVRSSTLPDVLFLQEVLVERLDALRSSHDVLMRPAEVGRLSGRHSLLALRKGLGLQPVEDHQIFHALGTYASCAIVQLGGQTVTLVSVHASPSHVDSRLAPDLNAATRSCESAPWWADALVAEVSSRKGDPLVIAGDFNEARGWDDHNPGHQCSSEFFSAMTNAGLTDINFRDWRDTERPTRRNPDYQLDHVFASASIADLVHTDDIDLVHDDVTDHAAITFTIKV